MRHRTFVTTSSGLDRQSPPMRLFEKAKRFGIWNPSDLDFRQDAQDWLRLAPDERDISSSPQPSSTSECSGWRRHAAPRSNK